MNTVYSVREGFAGAWDTIVYFTPKLLAFLLILVVGYFIARALGKVLDRILDKVGFDRMVERSGLKQALSQSGFHVSDILGKVVFYTLFLFVLQLAFGVFGPNPISELLTRVIAFLPNVFVAIVIVVISAAIAAGVREIVRAAIGGLSYGRFVATIASAAVLIVGVFAALNQLQIAPQIVNGLFYAMLAIVVGVSVVGLGGGLIVPMRNRWESMLNRVETEVPIMREHVKAAQADQAASPQQSGYMS